MVLCKLLGPAAVPIANAQVVFLERTAIMCAAEQLSWSASKAPAGAHRLRRATARAVVVAGSLCRQRHEALAPGSRPRDKPAARAHQAGRQVCRDVPRAGPGSVEARYWICLRHMFLSKCTVD